MELAKIRRAVEMASECKSVERSGPSGSNSAWQAVKWCNAIGDYVVGVGPDAWTAVQAVHALCDIERQRKGL